MTSQPHHLNSNGLPAKAESWKMFDRIARTYDALNAILSLGIDARWRRRLAKHLPDEPELLDLMDLATGTGDQVFALWKSAPHRFHSLTGTDLSENMLAQARHKSRHQFPSAPFRWSSASAGALPFPAAQFDVVTMSFGIRNVPDPVLALREIHRVLRPGGRALILEFSLPPSPLLRLPYLFYFRRILPAIGGLISGDPAAYRYLNRTVEEFPCENNFLALMTQAGLIQTSFLRLSGGIACLYQADRPALPKP